MVIFVIFIFVAVPVAFFFASDPASKDEEVKGVSNTNIQNYGSGVGFYLNSKYGTWDIFEFLCQDKESCTTGLMAGKRVNITSGGVVENKLVRIEASPDWDSNKYIKVFAKSGWGSQNRRFSVELTADPITDAEVVEIEYEGELFDVLIIPLQYFKESYSNIAVISD